MADYLLGAELIILAIVIIWASATSAKIVRPIEMGLVERFGRYNRFVSPGITFLVPLADRIIKVNITEKMSQVEPQDIITKDKVFMKTDAVIFYKVKPDEQSVKASEYNVANFQTQIETLARTVLRDIIGNMDMAEANVSRPIINERLKTQLDQLTNNWGIQITRAEIKDIIPPRDLLDSMESVLKADNTRQAAEKTAVAVATQASGEKNAAIQRAEGMKQAAILQAEGQKQATIAIAEGDAQATKLRNEALTTYFKESAITFKELETIQAALQNNAKIIVPEGKTLSLILDERNNLEKARIIPMKMEEDSQKSNQNMAGQ